MSSRMSNPLIPISNSNQVLLHQDLNASDLIQTHFQTRAFLSSILNARHQHHSVQPSTSSSLSSSDTSSDTSLSPHSPSQSHHPNPNSQSNHLNLVSQIITLLNDPDDEEKPDQLKDLLASTPALNPLSPHQLDQLVLSLLHRHRDETLGNLHHHHILQQPSLSRSSSSRRTCPSPRPPSSSSPSPSPLARSPHAYNHHIVDRLNAAASEFRPASVTRTTLNTSTSTSINPSAVWSFAPSPLGTPKFQPPANPYLQDPGSYFSSTDTLPKHQKNLIPRDPWLDEPSLDPNHSISCASTLEWGLSPAMADEMAHFASAWDSVGSNQVPTIALQEPVEAHGDDDGLGGEMKLRRDRFLDLGSSSASTRSRSKSPRPHSRPSSSTKTSEPVETNHVRVCRFFLQGSCLRSDCRFSHDVGKAVCRFWLRGHCLKGESKCDFLHELPTESPTMNHEAEQPLASERSRELEESKTVLMESDFPSLLESVKPRRCRALGLRASLLLPTSTIQAGGGLRLREEFGLRRRECLERAKQCDLQSDSAGSSRWEGEAEEWAHRQIEDARQAVSKLISERHRCTKDAILRAATMDASRPGLVDETADRMHRGKEMGGGVCLGVVKGELSVKERMETVLDLGGIQVDEAIEWMKKFMSCLKNEGYEGLAYVRWSEAEARSSERGEREVDGLETWLAKSRYRWKRFGHTICLDPIVIR